MKLRDFGFIENETANMSNWLLRWLNPLTEITLTYWKKLHCATVVCKQIPSLHALLGPSLYPFWYNLIVQPYLSLGVLVPRANDNTANVLHTKLLDGNSVSANNKCKKPLLAAILCPPHTDLVACGC